MKFYKVVRPVYDPNIFYSIVSNGFTASLLLKIFPIAFQRTLKKYLGITFKFKKEVGTRTTYNRNKWTFSKPTLHQMGYDLLVFDNLGDAKDAIRRYGWYPNTIFEVDVICLKKKLPPIRNTYFENPNSNKSWPSGSMMAWGVRLAKEIN